MNLSPVTQASAPVAPRVCSFRVKNGLGGGVNLERPMTEQHMRQNAITRSLNDDIYKTEKRLEMLYDSRRGRILWGPDDQPFHGYCCVCGRNTVDVNGGFDTCNDCGVVK